MILVSHAAFDHYGDSARIAKRTGAPVVCDAAVRAMLIDQGVSPDQVSATTWGIVVEVGRARDPPGRVPSLVVRHALRRSPGRRQPHCLHRRDRARRAHLPLRRHVHLRHAPDRRAVPAHGGSARLHAAARAVAPDPGPGHVHDRRDGRRRGGPRRRRCSASSSPSPATTSSPTARSTASCELVPRYDTTGRRRVVAPQGRRHARRRRRQPYDRERVMRLVTYTAEGGTRVGIRRNGAIHDAGYEDLHALIRDGAAGLERAAAAADAGTPVEGATVTAPIRPGQDPVLRRQLRQPRRREPGRGPADRAVLLLQAAERGDRARGAIRIPRESTLTDYEVELAMVIGRRGYRIPEERALEHVFGWTILARRLGPRRPVQGQPDHARQESRHVRPHRPRDRDARTSWAILRRCASRPRSTAT